MLLTMLTMLHRFSFATLSASSTSAVSPLCDTAIVTIDIPSDLTPKLKCVEEVTPDVEYIARLGYENVSGAPISVPIGSENNFNPAPADQGQPTTFAAGNHEDTFTVNIGAKPRKRP